MVFNATTRPIVGSCALYTTPMAPRPNSPRISYLLMVWTDIRFPLCESPALFQKPSGEENLALRSPITTLLAEAKNTAISRSGQRKCAAQGTSSLPESNLLLQELIFSC